jgi:hypothetical protein
MRCMWHVGPYMRGDQREREWPALGIHEECWTRICMRHFLLPWQMTMGIELHAGVRISGACFVCFIWILHVFYLDVTYVAIIIYVRCKCIFQMFQLFHLDVAYVAVVIHVCCKCMFQMFHLFQTYVVSVISECCICCSGYTHMLQAYVSI